MSSDPQAGALTRPRPSKRSCEIIAFCARRGGSGTTTATFLFAGELVRRGALVTIIDTNSAVALRTLPKLPPGVSLVSAGTEETLMAAIAEASQHADYVFIDVASNAPALAGQAAGASDFVVYALYTPLYGEEFEGVTAFMTDVAAVKDKPVAGGVLFTHVLPSVKDQALDNMERGFRDRGVEAFKARFWYRAAFREFMTAGGSLDALEAAGVRSSAAARHDAVVLTSELLSRLAQTRPVSGTPGL